MINQRPQYWSVRCLGLGVFLGAFWLAAEAPAQEPADADSAFVRFCKQDYLFGDWGGFRNTLKETGVDFEFVYFGAVPSNLEGGLKEGSVYEGALMMLLDLDSAKLAGYEGGQFHAGAFSIHNGPEFSANYVGDLNKVSLLDFPDNLNLWELWYEQKFLDDKVALKLGQLAIDRDFILPEYYNSLAGITFLNQTFFYPTLAFDVYDQPFFPAGNHGLASTPYGTPGARLRVDPAPCVYFQVGAYSGRPDQSRGGVSFPLSEDSGALIYAEATLKLNQGKDAQLPPGNLKLGGYYHTDEFYDEYEGYFVAVDNYLLSQGQMPLGLYSTARTHPGNYAVYFLADQILWREAGKEDAARQGLAGFARLAWAPPDRNLASFGVDGGLVYKGLIPKRDWDTLGLGLSYLQMSEDLREAQRDINAMVSSLGAPAPFSKIADYEGVLEVSYKAQLTAWWTLQTSVQRVFHPGGRVIQDTPNAWAVVVQTSLRL
jgi:porin